MYGKMKDHLQAELKAIEEGGIYKESVLSQLHKVQK